jgi:hypothetical protein
MSRSTYKYAPAIPVSDTLARQRWQVGRDAGRKPLSKEQQP